MKKRKILSIFMATAILSGNVVGFASEQTRYSRVMEYLDRGLLALPKSYSEDGASGMFLSWRLLGTENLETTTFDIYKNGRLIEQNYSGTSYTDSENTDGKDTDAVYHVVQSGKSITSGDMEANTVMVNGNKVHLTITGGYESSSYSNKNSYAYFDIPVAVPESVSDEIAGDYTYSANDCSVGDVDNDGQYELIVKWSPSDSVDNTAEEYTGKVLFSCYELDGTMLWDDPIDLGYNIRAGAHYTQYIVYDLDGDGYSEIVMKTAPGSRDGKGEYVNKVGNTEEIINGDNSADYRDNNGRILEGPEYLTVFSGQTGEALQTIRYTPYYSESEWGDTYGNRGDRFLAAVGYFGKEDDDGNLLPSVVMTRGYYAQAYAVAYDWDGENLTMRFYHDGSENSNSTLYGQGNHNLTVSDVDNDGYDEIVFGSAVLDNDGTVLSNTCLGHGDAMHVSDFNNDGMIEAFQIHEGGVGDYGGDFWIPATGTHIFGMYSTDDVAKGAMANIDDAYAAQNPGALAMAFTTSHANAYTSSGTELNTRPGNGFPRYMINSFVYWDGELDRELLDDNILASYDAEAGVSRRFYFGNSGHMPIGTNNSTKYNMCLTADILGDWREEIISRCSETGSDTLRVYISTLETDYRLTTLMHDSQYRSGVAAENVAYNIPPHTSYYIGSAALVEGEKYLAPAYAYTKLAPKAESEPEEETVTEYHFDFGNGAVQSGYAQVTKDDIYSKTKGYGFDDVSSLSYFTRSPYNIPDDCTNIYSDMVNTEGTTATFNVDIPNGNYKISIYYGAWNSNFGTKYNVEGIDTGNLYSTDAVKYVTVVEVTDGQFNLAISKSARSYGGYISGMDIEPITKATKLVAADIEAATVNKDAVGYYVDKMQISDTAKEYKWVITTTDGSRFVKKISLPELSGEGSISFGMIIYGILEYGDNQYTTSDISSVAVE